MKSELCTKQNSVNSLGIAFTFINSLTKEDK